MYSTKKYYFTLEMLKIFLDFTKFIQEKNVYQTRLLKLWSIQDFCGIFKINHFQILVK